MKKTAKARKGRNTGKATKVAKAKKAAPKKAAVKKAVAKKAPVKKASTIKADASRRPVETRKPAVSVPTPTVAAPPVRPISFKGRSFDASSVLCDEDDRYPSGTEGRFAVCHYLPNEAKWVFHRTATRENADARMRSLMQHADVLKVVLRSGPHAGVQSAVIWVLRHDGQNWQTVMETTGAMQHLAD